MQLTLDVAEMALIWDMTDKTFRGHLFRFGDSLISNDDAWRISIMVAVHRGLLNGYRYRLPVVEGHIVITKL
jgi:hypothetical protein